MPKKNRRDDSPYLLPPVYAQGDHSMEMLAEVLVRWKDAYARVDAAGTHATPHELQRYADVARELHELLR